MAKIIKLTNVRLSFPTLGEPEQFQGQGEYRWSGTFLVPKTDTNQIALVDATMKEVAIEKWGPEKGPVHLKNILMDSKSTCWIDGARKTYSGYAEAWALSSHRQQKDGPPIILDDDATPVYQRSGANIHQVYPGKEGRLFGGCYVDAQVEIWAQDNSKGKGLRATLQVVQRRRHGDSFGGASAPDASAFGSIADGADDEMEY